MARRGATKTGKTAAAPRAAWLEAAIRVPIAAADKVGALLVEAGSQGVITGVLELARGARRRTHETVRGFFPSREPVRARLAVRAALTRARDVGVRRAAVSWRELDARLWEMDWRQHFQPVRAGRSLVVVPPWDRADHGKRRRVVIHPGMAFGTGQHATTLGCLEALESLTSPPPARALDVGTGTGVLAIALAKLGVKRIVALDLDPQAITAARGNVRRNAIAGRVRLACKPLAEAVPLASPAGTDRGAAPRGSKRAGGRAATREDGYPLVVANLYVDALVELAPAIAVRVVPGGHLVTSGVLRTQQARVRAAYGPPLWRLCSAQRRGAWVTSVFERRGGADERRGGADERRSRIERPRAPITERRTTGAAGREAIDERRATVAKRRAAAAARRATVVKRRNAAAARRAARRAKA